MDPVIDMFDDVFETGYAKADMCANCLIIEMTCLYTGCWHGICFQCFKDLDVHLRRSYCPLCDKHVYELAPLICYEKLVI